MTIPPGARAAMGKVSDYVREMIPAMRVRLTPDERHLATYLRSNKDLYEALCKVIRSRIESRSGVPEPSDPMVCK